MKEIIEKIEETTWKPTIDAYFEMEGYKITTNKQIILMGISNEEACCENSGYFSTNDNVEDFIGAEITGLKLTDVDLNSKVIKDKFEYGFDEGGIQFIDIETDKGSLQLAVYNQQNGYYGHSIEIKSNQLTLESSL